MKTFLASVLLFTALNCAAQKTDENYSPGQYRSTTCNTSFTKVKMPLKADANSIKEFLKNTVPNFRYDQCDLKLNYVNESPGGYHYSFTQVVNGVPVYQSEVKVNTDKNNTIHSIFDNSYPATTVKENTFIDLDSLTSDPHFISALQNAGIQIEFARFSAPAKVILHNESDDLFSLGLKTTVTSKMAGTALEICFNKDILFIRNLNSYFAQDSLVNGKVFNPDPLTTAQSDYRTPYLDNRDSTNPFLDAQAQIVNFHATFDTGVFHLKSPYLLVSDFDSPNIPPVTSTDGLFYYNRFQEGFEDVNAFYHISTIQNHIHQLGFNCADGLVNIDTHAAAGADNSFFSPATSPARIYYGTGGVDDAEDADVCVHEYGHFVSETASPNSNSGLQRTSLDEGFGDYLAASYSRSLSTYHDNYMFNWDGHNEYWGGRIMNSTGVYPTNLTNSIYNNGQIWSAVLFSLNGIIGRAATDSLILQTHYSYAANISLADAGQLLLDADTLLTGGKYACPIYSCLFAHGLQPQNPFINCAVGINETEDLPVQFLSTPSHFTIAQNTGKKVTLQILTVTGQSVFQVDENQPLFRYENSNLQSGIYLISVMINGKAKTFKWCKLN
jgi:hypothetical protein